MYACIDLGSNSFHLLIAQWHQGQVDIVERFSERVQLGEGVLSSGMISATAYQRGMACLKEFKQHMDLYPVTQYWALGTNTFRVAANAAQFVQQAKDKGLDISIISGVQEAVLVYAGVITNLPVNDDRHFVADIGGGSTEVVVGQNHQRLITESLPIGCVSWRDRFFGDGNSSEAQLSKALDQAVVAAQNEFSPVAMGVRKFSWDKAYASSGTAKMLTGIIKAHGLGDGGVSLDVLLQLRDPILSAIYHNGEIPGLKEKRRDLLLSGWSVMVGMLQAYSLETMRFSATALREGMLDFMVKNEKTMGLMETSKLPMVSVAKS